MKDYMYKEALAGLPLAMAYVPIQRFNGICDNLEEALLDGTVFPELNKPFTGRRCCKK
ncbi:MAG: spore coat associated protein CotJA [Clostridiales bacterium]|nr:spore coat associated protein CotJA [Clostridiales bacterium]